MLSPEKVEKEGKKNADDNAGGEGEVEAEIFPLHGNIPRKLTYPGDFRSKSHDDADEHQCRAHCDEHLSHQDKSRHCLIRYPQF